LELTAKQVQELHSLLKAPKPAPPVQRSSAATGDSSDNDSQVSDEEYLPPRVSKPSKR
jgi:hypothetical protein